MALGIRIDRRAWIDFTLTMVLLGSALVLAVISPALSRTGDWLLGATSAGCALALALAGGLYIVPKLGRRVKWELWGFGIRTAITPEGFVYLTIIVVVGVAAWNTENNLLYMILAALLAFVVVSGNIARLMLHDVVVQLRLPDHLFAGDPAQLAVSLVNGKTLMPSCSIAVEANTTRAGEPPPPRKRRFRRRIDAGIKLAHFIVVPPRSSVRQVVEHTFARRGRYVINAFTLTTKFPAGFFKKWRKVTASGEIVVFPPVRQVDDFFHTLPMLSGSSESHVRGDGVDLYSLRDYRVTDHIRRIDWKASARSRRFIVRETVLEEDFRLSIFFDPRRRRGSNADGFADRFERGIEMAASLARHFTSEGSEVEFVTPSSRVPPGSGNGHLYGILTELAVIEPTESDGDDDHLFSWDLLDALPGLSDDHRFKVLFTSAPKGSIPARVWRAAHVVYFEDLDQA